LSVKEHKETANKAHFKWTFVASSESITGYDYSKNEGP